MEQVAAHLVEGEGRYWVGVDWGDKEHVVCVLDRQGAQVESFRVAHSPKGLRRLVERIRNYEPLGGVAIEASRTVVVQALLKVRAPLYAINPKLSCQWRKGWSVSEAKDDGRDARVLGHGLYQHHERLQPLSADTDEARELALLCEDERRLIAHHTTLVQQLRDTLKQYYPAALGWFENWTTQSAWDFVLTFPTPELLAGACSRKLYGFLKRHRIGLSAKWRERVDARSVATHWPSEQATVKAKSLLAVSLAKQLRALAPALRQYRERIEQRFEAHEDKAIFESLPGAGPKLAPRLASAFGTQHDRFNSAQALQQLSGTAPVTKQSGKRKYVQMRRACRKDFRTTLHLFAWQSVLQSSWARAYYELAKRRGQCHALALRNLANKWVKIIYRMWQNHETYDEHRYIEQLVRKRSPIAFEMGLLKTRG